MPNIFTTSIAWVLLALAFIAPAHAQTAKRMALVIGNAAYQGEKPLRNPGNDAQDVGAALRRAGVVVQRHTDLGRTEMNRAIDAFMQASEGAELAVVYYSGHGMQANGEAFLIPVDAKIQSERDVRSEGIRLGELMDDLEARRIRNTLLIIDACRDNPYRTRTKSGTKGLARPKEMTGAFLVAYATADGTTADDGDGRNGKYTEQLLKQLGVPGKSLRDVVEDTQLEVEKSTNGAQRPKNYGDTAKFRSLSLQGGFSPGIQFASLRPEATGNPIIPITPTGKPSQSGTVSLDDLEKEEATRKEWASWQGKMKVDYDKTTAFNGSADLQAKAWERFIGNWSQDNPLSREDEALREQARQKVETAKTEAARQGQAAGSNPGSAVAQNLNPGTNAVAGGIAGAGATFPAPIYSKWANDYKLATGTTVNYQSIGSGGGIKQIDSKNVDFGASDAAQTDEALRSKGQMQFPTVLGGVVPVINVKGIEPGQLNLTGSMLADIFLGKVTRWNDPAIKALNPTLPLPDADITPIRRADGSGTTFIFTNYLSKVSPEWRAKVGEGTAVAWPVGAGSKGNEGMAAFLNRLPNSIGYLEFSYVKQNKMIYVALQNAAGAFVQPTYAAIQAAAANADWSRSSYQWLTNQPGVDTWPISSATFIIMHLSQDKPAIALEVLRYFNWAFANGAKAAADLDYVPLPYNVIAAIQRSWGDIKDASGKAIAAK